MLIADQALAVADDLHKLNLSAADLERLREGTPTLIQLQLCLLETAATRLRPLSELPAGPSFACLEGGQSLSAAERNPSLLNK